MYRLRNHALFLIGLAALLCTLSLPAQTSVYQEIQKLKDSIDNSNDDESWLPLNERMGKTAQALYRNNPKDSKAIQALYYYYQNLSYAEEVYYSRFTLALKYSHQALMFARLSKDNELAASAYNNLGTGYLKAGYFDSAYPVLEEAVRIYEKSGNRMSAARSRANLANLYAQQGDNEKALELIEPSIQVLEKSEMHNEYISSLISKSGFLDNVGKRSLSLEYLFLGLKAVEQRKAFTHYNKLIISIGMRYRTENEFEKAIEYYEKVLNSPFQQINRTDRLYALNNIGTTHYMSGNYDLAEKYLRQLLDSLNDTQELNLLADAHNNLGSVLLRKNNFQQALIQFEKAADFIREKGSYKKWVNIRDNVANAHREMKNYTAAQKIAEENRKIIAEKNLKTLSPNNHLLLYKIYKAQNQHQKAFDAYQQYISENDSLTGLENKKELIKKDYQFQYEKKAAADSVKASEEKKVVDAQLKQEKTQRFALYGGLSLVGIFALFMVNRFRVTNKQKKLIEEQKKIVEEQKHLVEEKQKEILDSIHYAKRIQTALITNEHYFKQTLSRLKI